MSHSSLLRFLFFFFLVSYGKFFIELNLRCFEVGMRRAGKESKMGGYLKWLSQVKRISCKSVIVPTLLSYENYEN